MEKEKTYTTTKVMKMSGMTRAGVLRRAKPFGFTKSCKYLLKRTRMGNCIKECLFTESQVKQMGFDYYLRSKKEKEVAEKTKEEKLEKLKKEHPLVTDERCFTLSWFPEIIPSVLSEVEE